MAMESMGDHTFIVHRGGKFVTKDDLRQVPLPELDEGSRYGIVPHTAIFDLVEERLDREFPDHSVRWKIATSHEGKRLFAMAVLERNSVEPEMNKWGPGFAFRNSYDKSMRFGYGGGASVFICDNMALRSDFLSYSRVHIGDPWPEIKLNVIGACAQLQHQYIEIDRDIRIMDSIALTRVEQHHFLGECIGTKLVKPRMVTPLIQMIQDKDSRYGDSTVWRALNEVTEVMQTLPVQVQMGKLAHAHALAMNFAESR